MHVLRTTSAKAKALVFACLSIALIALVGAPADAAPVPAPAPGAGVIQFDAANYTVNETDGTITLGLQRVGGNIGQITATFQTHDGTATLDDDYAGIPSPLTLTWADGNTATKTVTLPIQTDTLNEPDETFTATITSPHAGTPNTATITIVGTLAPVPPVPTPTPSPTPTPATPSPSPTPTPATPGPTPTPSPDPTPQPKPTSTPRRLPSGIIRFVEQGYTVTEQQCTVAVVVERIDGSHGEVTTLVGTVAGAARGGEDYVPIHAAAPVALTWEDGDTSERIVLIKLIEDGVSEADESFNVVLLETTGAGQANANAAIVITETPVDPSAHKPADCAGSSAIDAETQAVAALKKNPSGDAEAASIAAQRSVIATGLSNIDANFAAGVAANEPGQGAIPSVALVIAAAVAILVIGAGFRRSNREHSMSVSARRP